MYRNREEPMIFPNENQDQLSVAQHYNDLNPWYLKFWGEHVHHGLWLDGNETSQRAVEQLVEQIAEKIQLQKGDVVCDIGCGYGAPARMFHNKWGAKVTGFSLSEKQLEYAKAKDPHSTYIHCDWLENSLPPQSFDAAVSIESLDHMVDKEKFFSEIYRVLKPGGRIAFYTWLSKENPKTWEIKHLLEPICREGRLPSLGSVSEYTQMMFRAGFEKIEVEDLSSKVKKTWVLCAWRMICGLRDRNFRQFLKGSAADRIFAKTVFRILAAYQTKSMVYCFFQSQKNG